jgi:hypothetical protein
MSHLTWKDSELSGLIVYTPSYLNPALYKLAQLFETATKDNKYNYVEASHSHPRNLTNLQSNYVILMEKELATGKRKTRVGKMNQTTYTSYLLCFHKLLRKGSTEEIVEASTAASGYPTMCADLSTYSPMPCSWQPFSQYSLKFSHMI